MPLYYRMDNHEVSKVKKPFDKKKWRDKKYGHSHKVDEWREKQKLAGRLRFKRLMKKEQKKDPSFNTPLNSKDEKAESNRSEHKSSHLKAKEQFHKKVNSKEQKKQDFLKRQVEKNEAIKKYKEKKAERFKILNAKTKRGQPKMDGRIELLLAKIEEQCKND